MKTLFKKINKDNLTIVSLNNYISEEVSTTKDALAGDGIKVYTLGTGKYIINQYPLKNEKVLEGSKVFLVSNNHDYVMEDLTGWSLNEVKTYANILGIKVSPSGYGYVTTQNISPGTQVTDDLVLEVNLST